MRKYIMKTSRLAAAIRNDRREWVRLRFARLSDRYGYNEAIFICYKAGWRGGVKRVITFNPYL